ncbi:MAG: FecR domain-containing protein [Aquaticitalea sp.]
MNISDQEKHQLRDRISESISRYIQRKRYIKYGVGLVAACALFMFSLTIFQEEKKPISPLDTYVNELQKENVPDQIKLILNDNHKVEIADTDAAISYSKSGEQVTIGDSESVKQKTGKDQKMVFNTLIVPYGKRSSIELADGSKVWLNSGSKLVFPATFIQEKREVYLEGEAIFEVAHDKKHPFIVKSGSQDIEVLGTVFNVSNYHDDEAINTVLKSGSVKISYDSSANSPSKETVTISPGTMATYDRSDKDIKTRKVEVEKYLSWRDGIFIFKNDSMQSIMKKVSRYYNIQIVINDKDLANTSFSGYLDVKDNVENVIKTIQETTKFNYTITNTKININ